MLWEWLCLDGKEGVGVSGLGMERIEGNNVLTVHLF